MMKRNQLELAERIALIVFAIAAVFVLSVAGFAQTSSLRHRRFCVAVGLQ
jgi:hypothetical protein